MEGQFRDGNSCNFCRIQSHHKLKTILNKALLNKYSTNQNSYYLSKINSLAITRNSHLSIQLKYQNYFQNAINNMKKYYGLADAVNLVSYITEYMKSRKEFPRHQQLTLVMGKYYCKKRLLEFIKISKMLKVPINIQNFNFSSFLISLNDHKTKKQYSNILQILERKDLNINNYQQFKLFMDSRDKSNNKTLKKIKKKSIDKESQQQRKSPEKLNITRKKSSSKNKKKK